MSITYFLPSAIAACTAPKICSVCKATEGNALGHSYTSAVTKAATCTADGVRTYTCSACGNSYTETIAKTGHKAGAAATCTTDQVCTVCNTVLTAKTGHKWTAATCTAPKTCSVCKATEGNALGHSYTSAVTKAATCTTDGVKTFTCSRCSHSYTETIAKTGHKAGAAATCTTDQVCTVCNTVLTAKTGHKWTAVTCTAPKTCSVCKATDGNALGHSYTSVVTKTATCTADGVSTYTCSACGDAYTETIAKLGHKAGATVMEHKVDATCTANGSYDMVVYCATCGEKLSSTSYTIDAKGHTPGAAATCTTDQVCTVCDAVLTEKLGHDYKAVVTAPTCTADGYTTYTCANCADSYVADEVSATGHSYTATVTTAPTHLTNGVRTYVCDCGDSYTESIEKTAEHNYNTRVVAPTCTVGGYTVYFCSCGDSHVADEVSATGHSYTGVVTTAPTCTTDGVKTFTCSVCGNSYTETMAKLGHTEEIIPAVEATCTQTGLTQGTKCAVCGEILVPQTETPVKEHTDADADGCCDHCNTQMPDTVLLGDVDGDGQISSSDARAALRAAVGLDTLTETQQKAADVNKDGEVTSSDARSILRAAVGLEDPKSWLK